MKLTKAYLYYMYPDLKHLKVMSIMSWVETPVCSRQRYMAVFTRGVCVVSYHHILHQLQVFNIITSTWCYLDKMATVTTACQNIQSIGNIVTRKNDFTHNQLPSLIKKISPRRILSMTTVY